MNMDKAEKKAFDKVINVLTEHNLVHTKDYIVQNYNEGCFYIRFCKKRYVVLNVQYFYERIPDITIFKIKHSSDGTMFLNIKVRIRR